MGLLITPRKAIARWFFISVALIVLVVASLSSILSLQQSLAYVDEYPIGEITQVSSGYQYGCALADSQVHCWGEGESGQLGNGSTSDKLWPVPVDTSGVLAGKTITDISAGYSHACAIADGQVYCWGSSYYGELGNNSTDNSLAPVAVDTSGVLAGKTITKISAGGDGHTCAIADGQVYCWGKNNDGQLGNSSKSDSAVPVAVDTSGVLAGKTVTEVSSGDGHTCALADNQVYCWVNNNYGQLGNGSDIDSQVPVVVDTSGVLAGKTITKISSGYYTACVIADGQAYCWGYGVTGRLGNNSNSDSLVPVAVDTSGVLAGKTISDIDAGAGHACALADGRAYCWGASSALGNNSNSASLVPVAVDTSGVLAGKTITGISAGGLNTCASADRQAYCWGRNKGLGNNSTENSLAPVLVKGQLILTPEITNLSDYQTHTNKADETLAIFGIDFEDGATVTIGGVNAPVEFGESNRLIVTIPESSTPGLVDIVVTNTNGKSATSSDIFRYRDYKLEVTSHSPSEIYVNKTSTIMEIEGIDFNEDVTVTIGGVEVEYVWRSYQGNYLSFTIPSSSTPGTVDIVVTNGDGQSVTIEDGFTYVDYVPVISQVSPAVGYVNTESSITLTGEGFNASSRVTIGGVEAEVVDVYLDSELVVKVPISSTKGSVDVAVTNDNSRSFTLKDGFTYIEVGTPQVNSVVFSNSDSKSLMTVNGENLVDMDFLYQGGWLQTATDPNNTLVVLNGTPLPWCTEGTGYTSSMIPGIPASDEPPCYYLADYGLENLIINANTVKIWLPSNFDIAAPGTISINGSALFNFVQSGDSGDEEDDDNGDNGGNNGGDSTNSNLKPKVTIGNQSLTDNLQISKRPTFTGKATPGAKITVTVHSDPVYCHTTADRDGNWSCTLDQDLPSGEHTVYVNITNPDNTTEQLGPYSVTVPRGNILTNLLAPNTGFQTLKQMASESPHKLGAIIIAIASLITTLLAAGLVLHRRISANNS